MKAAVMRAGALAVDDIPEPRPQPGQVIARTLACGICGSDLHTLQHADKMVAMSELGGSPMPGIEAEVMDLGRDVVMGHEFCAEVVELGDNVGNCTVGDIVVSVPIALDMAGLHPIGYSNDYPGGYAEYLALSDMLTVKVPNGLDPHLAALTEPMAVGHHAVEKSWIRAGDAAVVLGCGPVGLAIIASLRLKGVEAIVAADFSPARRTLATTMGATEAVDPRTEPAIDAWRRVDGKRRLVLFEAIGVPGILDQAMSAAPRGAQIVVAGVCMETDHVRPMVGIMKELNVQFVLGYDPMEFAASLHRIAEGEIDVTPMITGRVGIEGVPQAFLDLGDPEAHAKILVTPGSA